jgi:fluoride exporter
MMIAVFLGGFLGTALRFTLSTYFFNIDYLLGTFIANMTGTFFLATFYSMCIHGNIRSKQLKAFVATGLLGSLTTFSTFAFEIVFLLEQKLYMKSFIYLFGSYTFGLIIAVMMFKITKNWQQGKKVK